MVDRGFIEEKSQRRPLWSRILARVNRMPMFRQKTLTPEAAKRLEKQLKDFASGGLMLFWQRQGMYVGSALLTSYYYSTLISFYCFLFCELAELIDFVISVRVLKWKGGSGRKALMYHNMLLMSSTLSSFAVAIYAILVAYVEGPQAHFTPLFFLFAAGLFAAVNNHQVPKILFVRLAIYGATMLFIPLRDIWNVAPPLNSELWLSFATVVFVLYFVVDCSQIFLRLYRNGLDQLDELRLERDRAKAAYEVKSRFVSVVSHELRTPLTSIMGALGLLRSGAFDDAPARAENVLGIAHKNSKRLSNLINDLLDLQKLESGHMQYTFRPTKLSELIDDSIESIQGFADTAAVEIVKTRVDASLIVSADSDRVLQVLANLLSNAVKFSGDKPRVEISLEQVGGKARLSVTDFGVGIPENSNELVFGAFTQIDSSDHREYDGTGLGLNITRQIVQAHSAEIDYTSTIGKGTTFFVDFNLLDEG